jgi:thioredoxin 1
MEKILTKNEFSQFVENSKDKLALVDFKAAWCGPCRMLGQIFDDIFPIDGVVVGEVDLDEADEEIATEHGVRNIPTVLFFKNGLQIDRFTGMIGREAIENKIKENLEK